jgi:hypothetical protein
MEDSYSILTETNLKKRLYANLLLFQVAPTRIAVTRIGDGSEPNLVELPFMTKGVEIHGDHFVVWSGKQIEVYEAKSNFFSPIVFLNLFFSWPPYKINFFIFLCGSCNFNSHSTRNYCNSSDTK